MTYIQVFYLYIPVPSLDEMAFQKGFNPA